MPPDLAHQFNPSACQADFSYSITLHAVEIQDTGKDKKSVADDLERFCARLSIGAKLDSRLPHQLSEHLRDRAAGRMGRENGASHRVVLT
jgi:hypothetical protein